MSFENFRKAEADVSPLFIGRWSPRSFSGEEIPDQVLASVFEAARWAPSARNAQPWRFVYTKRHSPEFPAYVDFLLERNQAWASRASVLIVVLSKKTILLDGKETPLNSHSFDVGAAWANLGLQANLLGWHTRAIGGFDREKARKVLGVPDGFAIEIVIALGKRAAPEALPDALREQEKPSSRVPSQTLVHEGVFRG